MCDECDGHCPIECPGTDSCPYIVTAEDLGELAGFFTEGA